MSCRGSLEPQDGGKSRSSDEQSFQSQLQDMHAQLDLMDDSDLPTSIHVTNMELDIFGDESLKTAFEDTFSVFDREASFQYFASFRRARVNYSSPAAAVSARLHLHNTTVCGSAVKCYFIQPSSSRDEADDGTLHPPQPDKQFLISPPASPPVGWEPVHEAEPTLNYDLLTAVTEMAPGETHELHDGQDRQPSIVVHVAEEVAGGRSGQLTIQQTRCPSR